MTVANTSPPLGAPSISSSRASAADVSFAPDTRELFSIAAVAAVVLVAQVTQLGPRALAAWLPASSAGASASEALTLVAAQFGAWLLGALVLSVVFSLRWIPRAHQRLLEPSLIASWVSLTAAVAAALLLNRVGVWPWQWASTSPDVALTLTTLARNEHYLAVGLWLVCACLVVPLLLELMFRHALIEFLRVRGVSVARSIALASIAFAATYLAAWPLVAGAALQHAGLATVLGAVLGVLAVRGRRGRGLGLAIIAHGAFLATELAMLLRALPTG